MTGGKGRAPDHLGDVLGDELLVAGAVLHRADGTVPEGRRRRAESSARVHRLRGHDAEVAGRQVLGGRRRRSSCASSARRRDSPCDCSCDCPCDCHLYESSLALTSRYIAVCNGTGTPSRSASRTSEPVMKSTSVGRLERTSSSIDGTWA